MAFFIGLALAISDGPRLAQLAGPQQLQRITIERFGGYVISVMNGMPLLRAEVMVMVVLFAADVFRLKG